ncbi:MAG: UDP-N-acetylmuramoyl-L-alanine--D-glutamate ligase [Microthrixaceae bacterium]
MTGDPTPLDSRPDSHDTHQLAGTSPDRLAERRFLVHGLGVTNMAVAAALVRRGRDVVLSDDGDPVRRDALAAEIGGAAVAGAQVEVLAQPIEWDDVMGRVDAVVPTPGLAESHPLFAFARSAGVAVLSEFDLAAAWDDRPVLAITGTNGKTTVTTLVDAMLDASGVCSAAVGNTEVPLVAAIDDPATDVFVVEASSFRLAQSRHFEPRVATWLNFAPDHLDVHDSLDAYRDAKARIWSDQVSGDVAVVNVDDVVVAAAAPTGPDSPRVVRYGLGPDPSGAPVDYREQDGLLVGPGDLELARVDELWSSLPHDRSNVLAAAATALAGGADLHGVRRAIRNFAGLSHRVQLVGERDGVRWFDDSKATAPHATVAAVRGFQSVVLIAGGRNKGLDLRALGAVSDRLRGVVGIGEAADEVVAAFPDVTSVTAESMADAVRAAATLAGVGDTVLLSPACASFDWYRSYGERGDDFVACVRDLVLGDGS